MLATILSDPNIIFLFSTNFWWFLQRFFLPGSDSKLTDKNQHSRRRLVGPLEPVPYWHKLFPLRSPCVALVIDLQKIKGFCWETAAKCRKNIATFHNLGERRVRTHIFILWLLFLSSNIIDDEYLWTSKILSWIDTLKYLTRKVDLLVAFFHESN